MAIICKCFNLILLMKVIYNDGNAEKRWIYNINEYDIDI